MNFQVLCFDITDNELVIVQKEYFSTLEEAIQFANGEGRFWVGGTNILPMSEWAEKQIEQ